jgi:hypothetical protein
MKLKTSQKHLSVSSPVDKSRCLKHLLLDRPVACLWCHGPLQPRYLVTSKLKSAVNEVEERRVLAKDERLDRPVLSPELAQLLDERLDLGARPPLARVNAIQHSLSCTRRGAFDCRRIEVNRDWQVADWTIRLQRSRRLKILADTFAAENVSGRISSIS